MTSSPPSLSGDHRALGLAWTIPVLLLVYIGLGFWLGRLLGSQMAGVLLGWLAGMGGVLYEIRRTLRADSTRRPPPPSQEGTI